MISPCRLTALGLACVLHAQQPLPPSPNRPAPSPGTPASPQGPRHLGGPLLIRDPKAGKDVVLNFSNAKVLEVVQQVARVLGLNYVVDPAVKDVPLRLFMHGRLEKDGLLDVMGLALKLHGISVVRNGDFLEITPLASSTTKSAAPLYFGTQVPETTPDSFPAVQIVPLKFLDAETFGAFVKEFMSQEGRLLVDRSRNLVVAFDYVQHLRRVLDLAGWMDQSPFTQKKVALFRLKNASPDRLLKELEPVFKAQNMPLGSGGLQLVPIQSLNALFLVCQAEEWIPEVKAWIERLDEAPRTEEGELFVLPLRFAKVESLYPLLAQVLRLSGGATARPPASLPSPALGNGRVFGTTPGLSNLQPTPGNPATPATSTGPAQATSPTPSTPATGAQSTGGPLSPGASVTLDPDNNALVVFGSRRDASLIQSAVDQLDRMPRQVLIEATILDLSMTGDFEFGLSGFLKNRYADTETNLAGDPLSLTRDFRIDRADAQSPFSYTGLFTSRYGLVKLILSAKDSKKHVNVVSQPRVWALDNRPSRLLVQDQIPIPVNTFIPGTGTGIGSSGYSVTNAQYLDTGLSLTVTPHINGNGVIRLEIQQEISSSSGLETLGSGSSAIQAPRISRRSLATEMIAPSGATVILGGLVRQDSALSSEGLPLLNRLPFLRHLFGSTRRVNQKSELVILLTPEVMVDPDSVDRVTAEVRQRVGQVLDRMRGPLAATLPASPGDARVPREPTTPKVQAP